MNYLPELRRSLLTAARRESQRNAERQTGAAELPRDAEKHSSASRTQALPSNREALPSKHGEGPAGASWPALPGGLASLREWNIVGAWQARRWGRVLANLALSAVFVLGGLTATGAFKRGPAARPEMKLAPEAGLVPHNAKLLAIRTPDPAGGLSWGLRSVQTKDGLTCVEVGRIDYGTIGVLGVDGAFGDDGRFHPLASRVYDPFGCANTDADRHAFLNVALEGVPTSGMTGDVKQTIGCVPNEGGVPVEKWRKPCPAGDLREIYYGMLGPQAVSVTYRTARGALKKIHTVGPDGAYLLVLAQPRNGCLDRDRGPDTAGVPACQYASTGVRGGPKVPSGAITAVSYRDGHVCKVVPRTSSFSDGSCPPVGYAAPPHPKLAAAQVRTPIQIKWLPGSSFCDKRGPVLTSEEVTSVKRCGAHVPAGFERIAQPSVMLQLSFHAPVAIENARGRYEISYYFPRSFGRQPYCNGGGSMQTDMEYDVHRGRLMVERRTFPTACKGVVAGAVKYVRDNGPGGPQPAPLPIGGERKMLVGKFSFHVP